MEKASGDRWTQWLLHRRAGGDAERLRVMLEGLAVWRDQVLQHAQIAEGETVLDVGCGDGLIAFAALDKVGEQGKVIFSDISQDLLDRCAALAEQMQVLDRCQFVRAAADDLSAIASCSVDVVTTRSVLIYVQDKQQAFHECYRVLKPRGRLSIFEPINRFCYPEPAGIFMGYDVRPVEALASKVRGVFERVQPVEESSMLNFDERDLLTCAERAGFAEVYLDLQVEVKQPRRIDDADATDRPNWEAFLKSAGNPLAPTMEEAIGQALTPEEAEQFVAYLRPLMEAMHGRVRQALALLWAVKQEGGA